MEWIKRNTDAVKKFQSMDQNHILYVIALGFDENDDETPDVMFFYDSSDVSLIPKISSWKKVPCSNIKCYQNGEEPEVIYFIETENDENNDIKIIHEDAYQYKLGQVEYFSYDKFKEIYGINTKN